MYVAIRNELVIIDLGGVVNNDIQTAESFHALVHSVDDLVVVGDVDGKRQDPERLSRTLGGQASGLDGGEI